MASLAASVRCAGVLTALLACGGAQAARHGVEPAEMLPRGECELELAADRMPGAAGRGQAELQCRTGPVQLGAEAEHARAEGESQTQTALELRWARRVHEDWNLGLMLRAQWEAHQHPRHDATGVVVLATWKPRADLALHFNLGRDLARGGGGDSRSGLGAEWTWRPRWTLLLERYAQEGGQFARGSLRWAAGHAWTLEAGRAQRLRGSEPSRWTIAVSFDLDDD